MHVNTTVNRRSASSMRCFVLSLGVAVATFACGGGGSSPSAPSSPPSSPATVDYSGTWAGTTARGDSMSFDVANGQVNNFRLTLFLSPCLSTQVATMSFPISGNAFRFTMVTPGLTANSSNSIPIAGTFNASTSASGTWDSFVLSVSCTSGGGTTLAVGLLAGGTWTATKR